MRSSFGRLWSAYAVSTYGTWIAFGAFPLIAVRVLHAPAFAVSLLEAAGLAVAAVVAFPLGPWADRRAKRPVMIAMDLVRFLAMASVPVAYFLGRLSYAQLLVVSIVAGTANIAFSAASGAYLKYLVRGDELLVANGKFEGTSWAATAAGPPVGGALAGLLGPAVTVLADALSYLLSALLVQSIRGGDTASPRLPAVEGPAAESPGGRGLGGGGSVSGGLDSEGLVSVSSASNRLAAKGLAPKSSAWRTAGAGWLIIRRDPVLLRLFLNAILVGGLIMATAPLLAVLLLGQYRFPPWQYGLAFGVPALGGFAGARLSARLVARYGRHRVMTVSGWLRSIFPLGLAFLRPGLPGLLTMIVVEGLLIAAMGVFNPIYATERLRRTPLDHAAQVLSTWTVCSRLVQAALMVIWGVLAGLTSPLAAIAGSGVLLLATPLLLPQRTTGTV